MQKSIIRLYIFNKSVFLLHHFNIFIIYNVVILAWPFGSAHTGLSLALMLSGSAAELLTRNEN